MKFTKMHGIGNDYIYVNCFEETISNPEELSIKLSRRHYSVGSDGLVLIMPSDKADFRMRIFNAQRLKCAETQPAASASMSMKEVLPIKQSLLSKQIPE